METEIVPNLALYFDADHLRKLQTAGVPSAKIHAAIGYLTCYAAVGGYESVTIAADRDNDFVACYRNGDRRFVMGAIWNRADQCYGFHS